MIIFRVVVPLRRTAYHRLRIAEVRPEGPAAVSMIMTGHRLDLLGAGAGQFFGWRFGGSRGWSHAHPYSLSQAPTADRLLMIAAGIGHWVASVRRAARAAGVATRDVHTEEFSW